MHVNDDLANHLAARLELLLKPVIDRQSNVLELEAFATLLEQRLDQLGSALVQLRDLHVQLAQRLAELEQRPPSREPAPGPQH